MPSPRAVLIDIEKNKLNPKKAHKNLGKDGHLEKEKKSIATIDKSGLVFLKEKEKPAVFAAAKTEEIVTAKTENPVLEETSKKDDSFDEEKILEEMLLEEEKENSEEQKQSLQKTKKSKSSKI